MNLWMAYLILIIGLDQIAKNKTNIKAYLINNIITIANMFIFLIQINLLKQKDKMIN